MLHFIKKKKDITPTEEKKSFIVKALLFCAKSPINSLFGLFLFYYWFQAYLLGNSPWINKTLFWGVICLWILWFLTRHALKLLLVLIFAGAMIYGYYQFINFDAQKCEQSGGSWNKSTQICEEKNNWAQDILKRLEKYLKN